MSTRVALFGYGYWGRNLARNVAATDGLELAAILDYSTDAIAAARRDWPRVAAHDHAGSFDWGDVDAAAIATPAATHYRIAADALAAGKHVLVEKPLATTLDDARALALHAAGVGRVLLVDHTFCYTGAIRELRRQLALGALGDPVAYTSVRLALGLVQPDVDVFWDLAPHDLGILDYLGAGHPATVRALGRDPVGCGKPSAGYLEVEYESGLVASIHVSWFSPVKVRTVMLHGRRAHAVVDDLEPTEKLKLYDAAVEASPSARRVDYRVGDMVAPKLAFAEALSTMTAHFAACCANGTAPLTGGNAGVTVVSALDAAARSLEDGGARCAVR